MPSSTTPERPGWPTQLLYDSSSGRVDVIVDVSPASPDELTVAVGSSTILLQFDGEDGYSDELTFSPPSPQHRFDGEHRAIYNNGVLSVSVETATRIEA